MSWVFFGLRIKKRGNPTQNFAEIYQDSLLQQINNNVLLRIKKLTEKRKSEGRCTTYPAPYFTQFILLLLRTQRSLWRNVQYTYGRLTACILIGLLMGSLYLQIEYKDIFALTSRTLHIYMQVIPIGDIFADNVIPQIGTDSLVSFKERRAGMYHGLWVRSLLYFNTCICRDWKWYGRNWNRFCFRIPKVLDSALHLQFTLFVTYFGMMVRSLTPVPTLAAFAVSIVTSLWVSASGVVVVLSDIKFYKWIYWSNAFQCAMNTLTSISFYCNTEDCGSDCHCPRLTDGSYVWNRMAEVRSLNHERLDTDIIILSAICMLFASLPLSSLLCSIAQT
ncbi:hypothetical protein SLA2020_060120 [Shorea laevis]